MPYISEKDLAVFINLVSLQLGRTEEQLSMMKARTSQLTEGEIEDLHELQLGVQQYSRLLETLREDYELILQEGVRLPSFEELTRGPTKK